MKTPDAETLALPRWLRSWERFWFTPADPAVLCFIRVFCGILVLYTFIVYGLTLQETMGEFAWLDLKTRMNLVRERPVPAAPLTGLATSPLPSPADDFQARYKTSYEMKFGVTPPPPYPVSEAQADYLNRFRANFGSDLRALGLKPPTQPSECKYAEEYTARWGVPPPAYPKDDEEAAEIDDYIARHGTDPRTLYDRGLYVFSLWFYVTDPVAMAVVHGLFVVAAALFMVGFCTRFTSAITWFASLCYIHRSPNLLFGADTMMNILLLYLMIGPSGALFSVDHWLRWRWSKAHQTPPAPEVGAEFKAGAAGAPRKTVPLAQAGLVAPSVSANLAIRLLQVHLCIIYLIAGLAKLQGTAWWNGTAVWGVIACYEFAPMRSQFYMDLLRFVGGNQLYFAIVVNGGTLFTLFFEIAYAFLIWRPRWRWIFLASAIVLHGGIGLLMGLTTFALMMLVMNMAFLRPEEVHWLVSRVTRFARLTRSPASAKQPVAAAS